MNNAVYNIYIFDAHWLLYVVTIVLLCLNFVKYNSRLNNFVDVKSFLNIVPNNHISILYLNFASLPNFTLTVKSFNEILTH